MRLGPTSGPSGFKDAAWGVAAGALLSPYLRDRDILGLAAELGLADLAFFESPVTSILKDGRLCRLNRW